MKKHLIIALALVIVLSPFLANAQTNTALITQLQAQVAKLQATLLTLTQTQQSTAPIIGATETVSPVLLEPLTQIEIAESRNIKETLTKSNGHDYSGLYRSLGVRRGDLKSINRLCSQFDPIFCYKWAAKENANLRPDLCRLMITGIEQKYRGKIPADRLQKVKADHQRECNWGIPQFGR